MDLRSRKGPSGALIDALRLARCNGLWALCSLENSRPQAVLLKPAEPRIIIKLQKYVKILSMFAM